MVSIQHESLVELFRNRPSLAAEILAEALDIPMPAFSEARVASVSLNEIRPAEYRADLVVVLLQGDKPVRVIVVEVQLKRDDDKRFTWPAYLTVSRDQHRCPTDLLVVAPHPAIAAWCAEPIALGVPGFVLCPPVLGREAVPVVIDRAEAARRPELAVLSAMAHGATEHGAAIASAVLPVIEAMGDELARFYGDLVYNSLNEAARRALEAMMKGYEYQSDFAKKYYGQGRAEGVAGAVLTALRVRGIDVPEAARARILAEKDPARLERWLERAIVAASVAEVLDEPAFNAPPLS
jgi:hypothetical protein